MAGRILNRRELRKQADQAEQPEAVVSGPAAAHAPSVRVARRTTKGVPSVRKPWKPKAPPRRQAGWCVFDGGMKEIAIFDYNQRTAA